MKLHIYEYNFNDFFSILGIWKYLGPSLKFRVCIWQESGNSLFWVTATGRYTPVPRLPH